MYTERFDGKLVLNENKIISDLNKEITEYLDDIEKLSNELEKEENVLMFIDFIKKACKDFENEMIERNSENMIDRYLDSL